MTRCYVCGRVCYRENGKVIECAHCATRAKVRAGTANNPRTMAGAMLAGDACTTGADEPPHPCYRGRYWDEVRALVAAAGGVEAINAARIAALVSP